MGTIDNHVTVWQKAALCFAGACNFAAIGAAQTAAPEKPFIQAEQKMPSQQNGSLKNLPLAIAVGSFYRPDTGFAAVENFHHSCLVAPGGEVQCWGDNKEGQLGVELNLERTSFPVAVTGLPTPARNVFAGYHTTCAIGADKVTYCWGHINRYVNAPIEIPRAITGLSETPVSIAIGYSQACGLLPSGGVACWGDNSMGQLGDGSTAAHLEAAAVLLPESRKAVSVTAGKLRSCAALQNGDIYCWGYEAQPFVGAFTGEATPKLLYKLGEPCQQLTMSDYQPWGVNYCALSAAGQVYCWGQNYYHEVDAGNAPVREPQKIASLAGQFSEISMGFGALFGLTADGRLLAASAASELVSIEGHSGTFSEPVAVASGVARFSVGWGHLCVVLQSGGYQCWGQNDFGQLGNGSFTDTSDLKIAY
jgi:alpha-tubulin suppressor-like RCC1 family protein